jgi:hypothetical protein
LICGRRCESGCIDGSSFHLKTHPSVIRANTKVVATAVLLAADGSADAAIVDA